MTVFSECWHFVLLVFQKCSFFIRCFSSGVEFISNVLSLILQASPDCGVSPMKRRRQGVKSCSSVGEAASAVPLDDNSLVRYVASCIVSFVYFVYGSVIYVYCNCNGHFVTDQKLNQLIVTVTEK